MMKILTIVVMIRFVFKLTTATNPNAVPITSAFGCCRRRFIVVKATTRRQVIDLLFFNDGIFSTSWSKGSLRRYFESWFLLESRIQHFKRIGGDRILSSKDLNVVVAVVAVDAAVGMVTHRLLRIVRRICIEIGSMFGEVSIGIFQDGLSGSMGVNDI